MMKFALAVTLQLLCTAALAQEMPRDQEAFRDAIVTAREAYDGAANDLAKGGERPKRGKAICSAIPNLSIKDWVGTVYNLTTNGDGWGVFSIEMEGDIWLSTWNNSLSDTSYDTLIDPASKLFSSLAALKEGQQVVLSGSFFKDDVDGDCFDEMSMTMDGSMSQPEFIFHFASITPTP